MKNRVFMACAVSLLLASCSQNTTPRLPDAMTAPAAELPEATAPAMTGEEALATEGVAQSAADRLAALAVTVAGGGTGTTVRPDGTLLVGNQAMFPMGFYHVSWAGNAQKRLRDLNAIANLGFNTVNMTMFDPEMDLGGFTKVLDTAQARGMKVIVEDYNATSIAALKSHPATLGWMIADDCNNRVTPQELEKRHRATKALDPDHLTYTSMAISFANSHTDYFGRADAVGNQSYPIDGGDPISVVYPVMQKLVSEAAQKGTLPIANLQSFRWENGRYPTAQELNSMTNQALAAGVKGILYYTYLDTTNDMAKYTQLNGELRKLAREVKLLAPVLLNGERQSVAVPGVGGRVKATVWTYQGHRYLQVVNLNDKAAQSVTLNMPSGNALKPLFAGRPTGLKLQAGKVSGTLGTLSTHWYELN